MDETADLMYIIFFKSCKRIIIISRREFQWTLALYAGFTLLCLMEENDNLFGSVFSIHSKRVIIFSQGELPRGMAVYAGYIMFWLSFIHDLL